MTIDILSDHAYQDDALNFTQYATVLSNIIMNTTTLPFTVGIFGDWGSGKTTLMRMIQDQVNSKNCKTIWFNAWKYDDKQYLSKALLKTIYDEAMKSTDINVEVLKEILKRAVDFVGQVTQDKKWGTLFFETFSLDPAYRNLVEDMTHQIIKQYVGDKGRLVIFIDDLDRCLPENAITILETIKLYLDNERCVIVLGADRDVIEMAITQRYPKLKITGKDYLEKVVQLPFTIPQPETTRLRQYLSQQSLPTGEKFQETKQVAEMILSGAGRNMRRLKRLINQLNLVVGIAGIQSANDSLVAVLTKLLVLQTRFPEFYNVIEQHPDAISRFHQLLSAKDAAACQKILELLPMLESYQENQPLTDFFRKSTQVTCPNTKEVEQLMQLTVMAK
jgi:ABC-type dipeptide/oligopeptide/nickel transport system ATPase subunit